MSPPSPENAPDETALSTYALVVRSVSPTGSAACIFARVTPDKSVVVEPSDVVVPNRNTSNVSSQYNTAGLLAPPLLIIIPASVAAELLELITKILSSTDRFCESIVVVVPATVRSPVMVTES